MGFQWIGRRWVEFTRGYSGYLMFVLNFSNFTLILYGLAPLVKESIKFPLFVGLIVMAILPVAVLIGHLHFRKQYPIEAGISITKNPWNYKIIPKSKEIPTYKIQLAILEELHHNAETKERKESLDVAIKECRNLLAGNDTRETPE